MSQNQALHIVFFTEWYPHSEDPQNGVFIQKHAKALAKKHSVVVYHVLSDAQVKELSGRKTEKKKGRLTEWTFRYPARKKALGKAEAWKHVFNQIDRVDVVHLNILNRDCTLWDLWLQKTKIPFVVHEHSSFYLEGYKKNTVWHLSRKRLIKRAHRVLPVSQGLMIKMKDQGLHGAYQVVPNIVRIKRSIARSKRSTPIKLISVGDLVNGVKQFDQVLRALKELEIPFEYSIVGDGKDREELEEIARALYSEGLEQKVQFLGRKRQKAVQEMLQEFDLLISNSAYETFGLVVLEALACGVPVISRRTGVSEDFIKSSRNGYLIDSAQELSKRVLQFIEEEDGFNTKLLSDADLDRLSPRMFRRTMKKIYQTIGLL